MSEPTASKWIRSAADEHALAKGCWFNERAAAYVVDCFRQLKHVNGSQWADKPFEPMDWQRDDVIYPLFGWMRADGSRRYRIAYIEIPKKNGKSELCAAFAIVLFAFDEEPGAEVYTAAAARDQAVIVYRRASAMAKSCDLLRPLLKFNNATYNIAMPSTNSFLRAISADAGLQEGHDIHGCVIDELHAHPNRDLWDALIKGGRARRQPLIIAITTAGWDRLSNCYQQHRHAEQILAGEVFDDEYFAYVRAAGKHPVTQADGTVKMVDDDWTDPNVWRKANPSMGILFSEEAMAADVERAKQMPSEENNVKQRLLNIWTEQFTRWIALEKWDACASELPPLIGLPCWGGLDLASVRDIAALVLHFPDAGNALLPFFWIPREGARERARADRVPYLDWADEGLVKLTDGDVIDYDVIRADINKLKETYDIREIAVDRWNSTQLTTQLQGDGFQMIAFGQGFASMNAPTKHMEKLILAGDLNHGGNPVLRWMFNNVAIQMDPAGNIKITKEKSAEKVDGMVAAVMAIGRQIVTPPELGSVYASGEVGV